MKRKAELLWIAGNVEKVKMSMSTRIFVNGKEIDCTVVEIDPPKPIELFKPQKPNSGFEKNYLSLSGKHKPYSVRMRRQRVL